MLENPEFIEKMVHETGAHSTDPQSPESVEHLTAKTHPYADNWTPMADKLWSESHPAAPGAQAVAAPAAASNNGHKKRVYVVSYTRFSLSKKFFRQAEGLFQT